jgi:hypothetical protein
MTALEKKRRGRPPKEIQVIKMQGTAKATSQPKAEWEETLKLSDEIKTLAKDVEKSLDEVAKKQKVLNEKIIAAYHAAPLTDCGFTVSPLGPQRILHAFKNHLRKKGFIMDGAYVGDTTKLQDYSEYVNENVRWLTKFSTTA